MNRMQYLAARLLKRIESLNVYYIGDRIVSRGHYNIVKCLDFFLVGLKVLQFGNEFLRFVVEADVVRDCLETDAFGDWGLRETS